MLHGVCISVPPQVRRWPPWHTAVPPYNLVPSRGNLRTAAPTRQARTLASETTPRAATAGGTPASAAMGRVPMAIGKTARAAAASYVTGDCAVLQTG